MYILTATAIVLPLAGLVRGCTVVNNVEMTFYGAPDNSPPGDATAYNCAGRNYVAGGTGTYSDPLTFASNLGEFQMCEIIYAPYLKKYLRMEDDCVQCDTDYANGILHIDIWTGGTGSNNGGQSQINCEDDLTPNNQAIIRNPATNLPVDSTVLWDQSARKCNTKDTYPSYSTSTYCSSGSSGTCQTGCSWAGHCIGCPCQTENECSDDYICTNGLCANP